MGYQKWNGRIVEVWRGVEISRKTYYYYDVKDRSLLLIKELYGYWKSNGK